MNWRFRLLRAEVLRWEGKTKEALAALDSTPPSGISGELLIRTEIAQARALVNERKLPDAQARLSEAQQKAAEYAPELLGEVAFARGSMQYDEEDYSSAETTFQEALEVARSRHQPDLEAKIFGSLSRLFTTVGQYDAAVDWGKKSLDLSLSLGAKHVEAVTRLNLGWSYLELGDFENAIPFFTESERLAAQAQMKPTRRNVLNSLGRIYFNEAKYTLAHDRYHEALELAQELHDDRFAAICFDNLALVAAGEGKTDEAKKYNADALAIKRKDDDRVEVLKSLLTEASIANDSKQFNQAKPLLQEVITDKKTTVELRWEAEEELARLYVATHQENQARTQFKKVLDTIDSARSTIHDLQNKLAFSSREWDFYTNYIGFLTDQQDFLKALQVAESVRARTLKEGFDSKKPVEVQPSTVQNFLRKSGRIALVYWLGPDKSYLWAITSAQLKFFVLPAKQEIEAKIDRYQKSITGLEDVQHIDGGGRELYQLLVEPARQLIPSKAQVVVVPDGGLGKMNFETLIVPGPSPHFWIEDVQTIEDANSLALLIKSRFTDHVPRKLLAIGDPVEVTTEYPKLKYAPQEMDAAAEHFADKVVIPGRRATPSSYIAIKPDQFDVIHFATHGFASVASPLDSAIILSPDKDNSFKLYARDIVKVHLKADIVTISACYGAGKRTYSGEGLVGLAWAFLRAGSHQVIAGLWNVEDQSTPELMRTFYTELVNGKVAAAALHDAKIKMLHSTTVFHLPYYWASLQLYTGS